MATCAQCKYMLVLKETEIEEFMSHMEAEHKTCFDVDMAVGEAVA